MRWLGRLLGGLLASAVVVSVGAWELDHTLWSADYLQQKADQTHLADQLAGGVAQLLAAEAGVPADAQVSLEQAVTPAFVRDQIEVLLPQLERYYREGGPLPQLDLSDLEQRIEATGLVVPPGLATTLEQPQTVTAGQLDPTLASVIEQTRLLTWAAPLAAAILAGLVIVTRRQRRWLALAGSALGAALGVLGLAGLALVPLRLLNSMLATSSVKGLAEPIRAFAEAIARDQIYMLLWTAAALVTAALVLMLIHGGINLYSKFSGHKKLKNS